MEHLTSQMRLIELRFPYIHKNHIYQANGFAPTGFNVHWEKKLISNLVLGQSKVIQVPYFDSSFPRNASST
jgi:hypothetical protein